MVLKKQVIEDIRKRFKEDLNKIHMELNANRSSIKKLAERQGVLKREIKTYYELMRSLPKEA